MDKGKLTPKQDNKTGRFVAGNGGNGGRQKGSRNILGEQFVAALQEDFEENGVAAIETVRLDKPDAYLKVIASILPKEMNVNVSKYEDMTDEQLIQRLKTLQTTIAPFIDEGSGGNPRPSTGKTRH